MNILTRKEDDVVVYIAATTEAVSNGILVNNEVVFGNSDLFNVFENVTVPEGAEAQVYKYTEDGGFVKNADYVPYVSAEEKLEKANERIALVEQALQDLLLGGTV